MITAVDTNVLLDVFGADPEFGESSREALRTCRRQGALVAAGIVWAELAGVFEGSDALVGVMGSIGIAFGQIDRDVSMLAGRHWSEYRKSGGSRTRIVPDFLVGAHAQLRAERLLSRDRGFFRKYFVDVEVIDPTPKEW